MFLFSDPVSDAILFLLYPQAEPDSANGRQAGWEVGSPWRNSLRSTWRQLRIRLWLVLCTQLGCSHLAHHIKGLGPVEVSSRVLQRPKHRGSLSTVIGSIWQKHCKYFYVLYFHIVRDCIKYWPLARAGILNFTHMHCSINEAKKVNTKKQEKLIWSLGGSILIKLGGDVATYW